MFNTTFVAILGLLVVAYYGYFRGPNGRRRRFNQVVQIRKARHEERMFGELFLDLAEERYQEIKCLVYQRHFPWGRGYEVWLTWLGEPDVIVSVRVNFSLPEKRRIEIRQWSTTKYFSTDRGSLDQATAEFETQLVGLIDLVSV